MDDEGKLIEAMQKDTAIAKRALARIAVKAAKVATINHKAGRHAANADAMVWEASVHEALAVLLAGHGRSSDALLKHYGAEVIAAGPVR